MVFAWSIIILAVFLLHKHQMLGRALRAAVIIAVVFIVGVYPHLRLVLSIRLATTKQSTLNTSIPGEDEPGASRIWPVCE
jgi:hypothetical protein